jgi:phage terminase large subunit-like protein
LVQRTCKRHLSDLETGLYFDPAGADRILNFAKILCHTEGALAGQSFQLQPWQVFRTGSVFGWKREATPLRLFRKARKLFARSLLCRSLIKRHLPQISTPRMLRGYGSGW